LSTRDDASLKTSCGKGAREQNLMGSEGGRRFQNRALHCFIEKKKKKDVGQLGTKNEKVQTRVAKEAGGKGKSQGGGSVRCHTDHP